MAEMISIIVPVYNSEKYLRKCLDSLINQSYENIEILCVNDGSTDDSQIILDEYAQKDSRVKIFLQKNSGPAVARNKALEEANGQYIMFCDSDDWYEADMCKKMLDAVKETDADLVSCDCNIISDIETQRTKDTEHYFSNKILGLQKVSSALISNINYALWLKLFKKDIIENNKIRFPEFIYSADDAAFILKYIFCSKSYYGLNKRLYNYRITQNSIMEQVRNKDGNVDYKFDRLKMISDVITFAINKNIFYLYKEEILKLIQREFVISYHSIQNNNDKLKAFEFCNNLLKEINIKDLKNIELYLLKLLKQKKYKQAGCILENNPYYSLFDRLFSLKDHEKYRIISILGIKIKTRSRHNITLQKLDYIIYELNEIKKILRKINNPS